MEGGWSTHAPAALPSGKRTGTQCIGGGVGPRAGLDGWGKSRPPLGFNPRTVQPVASRYTDYAILAHRNKTGPENVGNDICCDTVWSEGKYFVMTK